MGGGGDDCGMGIVDCGMGLGGGGVGVGAGGVGLGTGDEGLGAGAVLVGVGAAVAQAISPVVSRKKSRRQKRLNMAASIAIRAESAGDSSQFLVIRGIKMPKRET